MAEELRRRKYDPDPVRAWKKVHADASNQEEEEQAEDDETGDESRKTAKIGDYDYLLDMPMRSLTLEKKEELLRKRDEKLQEYNTLCARTPADIWREDLDVFLKKLEELEEKEQEEAMNNKKPVKAVAAKGRKKMLVEEVLPSPKGKVVFVNQSVKTMTLLFCRSSHCTQGRRRSEEEGRKGKHRQRKESAEGP